LEPPGDPVEGEPPTPDEVKTLESSVPIEVELEQQVAASDDRPSSSGIELFLEPEAEPPLTDTSVAARPTISADPHWLPAVYLLAGAMAGAAVFGMIPAVWDVADYWRLADSQFVARWALVLVGLGLVQIAYAVYLVQLPDWTSVWVVTLHSLALAALYAMVLGLVFISREDGAIVRALQLSDKLAGGQALLWCLCMVSICVILAFFAGRLSVQWHKAETLLRRAGL
jgi:hypothetical protein